MTGIESLRKLSETEMSLGYAGASNTLKSIADQIESEQVEAAADHAVVASVVAEMERHVLGHEGMEDSPVARWARELRAALGGHVEEVTDVATICKDAYDAYEWVEAHGGLDAMVELSSRLMTVDALRAAIEETCTRIGVEHTGDLTQDAQAIWREIEALRSRLNESVPRAAYERHMARRQRQINESHAALRRRNRRIVELEHERDELREMIRQLNAKTDEMEQCLMPEGMEWPRYSTGELVYFGDEVARDDGDPARVDKIVFYGDQWRLYDRYGCEINEDMMGPGERVKRPAPEDSWERLEEDVAGASCPDVYCASHHINASDTSYEWAMARDIVRRAKALAERGR